MRLSGRVGDSQRSIIMLDAAEGAVSISTISFPPIHDVDEGRQCAGKGLCEGWARTENAEGVGWGVTGHRVIWIATQRYTTHPNHRFQLFGGIFRLQEGVFSSM